ncbi:toxin-antitoxin system HicB family antitoxin [Deinococcus rubellus]|uniref:toxin-antitoxin system HicB family antitoxin n=1 Tax=Deinococcus rubellus TaxID=1889240 RepID=UPI0031E55105
MKLDDALKATYPITIIPAQEGGYVAVFPDLPGLLTQAETLEELMVMAEDAKRGWMEVVSAQGQDIPAPGSGGDVDTYSGKFNLRVPKTLHRDLARRAEREGVSLNQWAVTLLAEGNRAG